MQKPQKKEDKDNDGLPYKTQKADKGGSPF